MEKNLPEIGKTYINFDDGKIHINRMYNVVIDEIIPFDEIGRCQGKQQGYVMVLKEIR